VGGETDDGARSLRFHPKASELVERQENLTTIVSTINAKKPNPSAELSQFTAQDFARMRVSSAGPGEALKERECLRLKIIVTTAHGRENWKKTN